MRKKDVQLDLALTTRHRTVEFFLKDLEINFEHLTLPWTVEKVARASGSGTTRFIHRVKSLRNMTLAHYLVECR
jgi:hypothetical protein